MKKYQGVFIYMIFATIIAVYVINVRIVQMQLVGSTKKIYELIKESFFGIVYIVVFTLSAFMMCWCLLKTMLTDPGKVPQNWGFFLNDPEQKKRRFCLICHIFKPERCHHCSACNRCVLNMDHHCPWIMNCVGFQNRKYFLQMLFYVIITTLLGILGLGEGVFLEFKTLIAYFEGRSMMSEFQSLAVVLAFSVCCLVFVLIAMFFKFHLYLVFANRTTIENLDRKRIEDTGTVEEHNQFDIGQYYNWLQVFGMNKLLWFVPIQMPEGNPVGDGVLWPKAAVDNNNRRVSEIKLEDISSPHITSPKTNDVSNNAQSVLPEMSNNWRLNSGRADINITSGLRQQQQQQYQVFQNQNYGFVGAQHYQQPQQQFKQ